MRQIRRGVLACFVAVVAVAASVNAGAASTESADQAEPNLQRALDRLVAAGAPGAVALVRDGEQTVVLTSGEGNLASNVAIRADDRFRIGSVTKSFVATVVLQLVGEGKLSLTDTVARWLPGLIPNGRHITVHELLNHTSGLYNYTDSAAFINQVAADPTRRWTPRELIAVATAHKPLFPPGTSWSYSNTGYIVLGLIVRKVTGTSVGAELRHRLFNPLHLRRTSYATRPGISGHHAHGYLIFGQPGLRDVTRFSPSFAGAAGAIVSTSRDVARFYHALLSGHLLHLRLLHMMETTVPTGSGFTYGLGVVRARTPCGVAWGHDGDFPGYLTTAFNNKNGNHQIVVLVNDDSLSARAQRALSQVLTTAYCDN
jgi:D-alanyl-D-alanine carboxypeptidase